MKTVFVIGSNSFSGSDFVDLLLGIKKYYVIGVSRSPEKSQVFLPYRIRKDLSNFEFQKIDLNRDMQRLFELLEHHKPAYIVNFAAQGEVAPSWENPEHWFQTNTVAIAKLSNYLKDKMWLEKYVHISSPEIYGSCEGVVKEDSPYNPSTPYAASKAAGDMMLLALCRSFCFPLVIIRSTNVYGAHQQLFRIIPRSIIYLKLNRKIELHGGGHAIKSYIHIRDVSRGELAVMENGNEGDIYHLSPKSGVKVRDIVDQICKITGKDFASSTIDIKDRLGQDKSYVIDSTKARESFNWKPEIGITKGISEVVKWINENWSYIKDSELEYKHQP